MKLIFDSFWRALVYCLHPRVWMLALVPVIVMALLCVGLGYLFWDSAIGTVQNWLESSALLTTIWGWFQSMGVGGLKTVVAPLVVIAVSTPVIVVLSLLVVAFMVTPTIVNMVASRRFPDLQRLSGASWFGSLMWAAGSVVLAMLAMAISVLLWLVPGLVLILPPLIWGWLTYRVLAFDALAEHASVTERRTLFRQHRVPLLAMGLFGGYLSALPSILWASGAFFVVWFVFLVPLAIWLYTFVFAFTSLWFAHYCLAALAQLRQEVAAAEVLTPVDPTPRALTPTMNTPVLISSDSHGDTRSTP